MFTRKRSGPHHRVDDDGARPVDRLGGRSPEALTNKPAGQQALLLRVLRLNAAQASEPVRSRLYEAIERLRMKGGRS